MRNEHNAMKIRSANYLAEQLILVSNHGTIRYVPIIKTDDCHVLLRSTTSSLVVHNFLYHIIPLLFAIDLY